MEKLSVQLLSGASLLLAIAACASADSSRPGLTQKDLCNPRAVVKTLRSDIDDKRKDLAKRYFLLGVKYRQRAVKDGNWGPAAKAFGESSVFYPRPLALKEYAESSLRSRERTAANRGLEAQLEVLKQTVDLYKSAIAADSVLNELGSNEKQQLEQNLNCSESYLQTRKPSASCLPLSWIGIVK